MNMDKFTDERDNRLLEADRYTFFVLRRVMKGECELLLTDHERLIICYTGSPYPVWIWLPDGASREETERAYTLVKENGLLDGAHTFNMKYETAEYFIERAAEDGIKLSINVNMFAYDCPEPIKPAVSVDGGLYRCTPDDTDEVTELVSGFWAEALGEKRDRETDRATAEESIAAGKLFLWKTPEGRTAACCKYIPSGELASLGLVYTLPEFRRKHYAQNMVYEVTKLAAGEGYTPMLYTNADYAASNGCYVKIGYLLRGRLCTIG